MDDFAAQPALLYAYENFFGTNRSQVQILSPRPVFALVNSIFSCFHASLVI